MADESEKLALTAAETEGEPPEADEERRRVAAVESATLNGKDRREAKRQAELRFRDERKKQLKEDLIEQELEALRAAAGVAGSSLGGALDELVSVTINLPENSFCLRTNACLRNEMSYYHGVTYSVPRHIYNDLRARMQAAWDEDQEWRTGRSKITRRKRGLTVGAGGITDDTGAPIAVRGHA